VSCCQLLLPIVFLVLGFVAMKVSVRATALPYWFGPQTDGWNAAPMQNPVPFNLGAGGSVSPAATQSDVQASVSRWCDLAVPKQSDKSKCYSSILGSSGGTTSNDANWAKWLCQANNLGAPNFNSAVNSCISYISANGINNYVAQYGPGYGLAKAGDLRCAPDASYYSPRTQAQSCQMGLSVQYLKTGGTNEWVEEFFVPTDFPPCTPLVLTAAAYPTLFTNEMQVTQCDLPAECKLQGSCEQAPGFQTMINYAGCP